MFLSFFLLVIGLQAQEVATYKTLHDQGRTEARKGEWQAALKSYDQAISRMPYYSMLYFDRAMAHLELEQFDKAKADFSLAIQKRPSFPQSYKYRGIANIELGFYIEARQDLQEYLRMTPTDGEAQEYLRMSQQALYRVEQAQLADAQAIIQSQNQEESYRRELRRRRRRRVIWGSVVPLAVWTGAWWIWR